MTNNDVINSRRKVFQYWHLDSKNLKSLRIWDLGHNASRFSRTRYVHIQTCKKCMWSRMDRAVRVSRMDRGW
jgi:hypothetical protein